MTHFIEAYADQANRILHQFHGSLFYKQEIVEVPGLLTGLLITYDGIKDDAREIHANLSWEDFLKRMSLSKPDWNSVERKTLEGFRDKPEKCMGGYEGRTIYFIKGGNAPQYWTAAHAEEDVILLLKASVSMWGKLVHDEVTHLREIVPVGKAHFREYEHKVRVIFNFLFLGALGQGQDQSRTEPENEGLEIRDIIFANKADSGFWKSLKDNYKVSEVVVDAKNTDGLTRDDLRQLYCYLKRALGFWGFIVCRTQPPEPIQAFNRTLYKNFSQERGILILCDDDLRKMVEIKLRGNNPSDYLQERMSAFTRSI
jgi:hypothetical protein